MLQKLSGTTVSLVKKKFYKNKKNNFSFSWDYIATIKDEFIWIYLWNRSSSNMSRLTSLSAAHAERPASPAVAQLVAASSAPVALPTEDPTGPRRLHPTKPRK